MGLLNKTSKISGYFAIFCPLCPFDARRIAVRYLNDVISVENRFGLVSADLHGGVAVNARSHHILDGGAPVVRPQATVRPRFLVEGSQSELSAGFIPIVTVRFLPDVENFAVRSAELFAELTGDILQTVADERQGQRPT